MNDAVVFAFGSSLERNDKGVTIYWIDSNTLNVMKEEVT